MTRDEALQLMHEHTQSPALRQHMLAVEAAMRAYAVKDGEDPEPWGMVGLLHDFDYEKFPNHEHSPTEGHPAWGVQLLRERGLAEPLCRAILGHATYSGVPRDSGLAKALFAVDELCGFLVACALRSEEHTSELQSRLHLVCRLLLEKKKNRRSDAVMLYMK